MLEVEKPRDFTRLTQHFFFLQKRKPVLKEKQISSFGKAFLSKKRFLVNVFTKPLQGLRGRGAEPHRGKKVDRRTR